MMRTFGFWSNSFHVLRVILLVHCNANQSNSQSNPHRNSLTLPPLGPLGESLDDALLSDMFPPITAKCKAGMTAGSTTYSFDHSPPVSDWSPVNERWEAHAFLASLSHTGHVPDQGNVANVTKEYNDTANSTNSTNSTNSVNRTNTTRKSQQWTIRIGKGGNIYSYFGAFGEAIPPQASGRSPWVDEVHQSVAVGYDGKTGKPYFLHEAGSYMDDHAYMPPPYYSPNIAKFCSMHACSFASWGQPGQVPSKYMSDTLFFTRYANCGHGVLEQSTVIHNLRNEKNPGELEEVLIGYENLPWGGVRASTFLSAAFTDAFTPGGGPIYTRHPIQMYGRESHRPQLRHTQGYTIFAQQLVPPTSIFDLPCASNDTFVERCSPTTFQTLLEKDPNATRYSIRIPPGDNPCYESKHDSWKVPVYWCRIMDTLTIEHGCRFCNLLFVNTNTSISLAVQHVKHWSWRGNKLFFVPANRSVSIEDVNDLWNAGDGIEVTLAGVGSIDEREDNYGLAFVHGVDEESMYEDPAIYTTSARMRYGYAGNIARDYLVYTVQTRVKIYPGETFLHRQFLLTDNYANLKNKSSEWVPETTQHFFTESDHTGRTIRLYSHSNGLYFGASIGAFMNDDNDDDTCAQGSIQCTGQTTPGPGFTALFQIQCGSRYYVGHDRYHFVPPRNNVTMPVRSYDCGSSNGSNNVRPKYKLLGYFPLGSCDHLQHRVYDERFCTVARTIDEILLEDILPPISDACLGNREHARNVGSNAEYNAGSNAKSRGSTLIYKDHYGNSADSSVFLAEMAHQDINPDYEWTARFGSGGTLYSLIGPYGQAMVDPSIEVHPYIESSLQISMTNYTTAQNDYLNNAGIQSDFWGVNDHNRLTPTIARHCENHACSFGAWASKSNPSRFQSNALLFTRFVDCGSGVVERSSAVHNGAIPSQTNKLMNNLYVKVDVNSTVFPNIWREGGSGLELDNVKYPTITKLSESSGYLVLSQEEGTDPLSLAFVHGKDGEKYWSDAFLRGDFMDKRDALLEWGHKHGDKIGYSVKARAKIRPGITYFQRDYILSGRQSDLQASGSFWSDQVIQGLHDRTLPGRTIRLHSSGSSFGAAGGDDPCRQGTLACRGSSLPLAGKPALFAISCGNVHYVGSDKYHFSSKDGVRKEYSCDVDENSTPRLQLLGYFEEGACDALMGMRFDSLYCNQFEESPTVEQILLQDIMPESSSKCQGSDTTQFHTSSSFSSNIQSYLVTMTSRTNDPHSSWSARFGSGGTINSFVGSAGEICAHSSPHDSWQMGITNYTGGSPDFLMQAGGGASGTTSPDDSYQYSPSLGHYCSDNGCWFATWAQKLVPSSYDSNALLFTRVVDCGSGVLEMTNIVHNSAASVDTTFPLSGLYVPKVRLDSSSIHDIFRSSPEGEFYLSNEAYPGVPDTKQKDSGGFTAFVLNKDDPQGFAMSFVHGKDSEKYDEEDFSNGDFMNKRDNRIRWGFENDGNIGYGSFVKAKVEPGFSYYKRDYIAIGPQKEIGSKSKEWVTETIQGFWNTTRQARTIKIMTFDNTTLGAVSKDDKCHRGRVVCEGSSVPQEDKRALFAISCGSSHYVGFDKYHFSPPFDEIRREGVCKDSIGRTPRFKLLGYFQEESCDGIEGSYFDKHYCSRSEGNSTETHLSKMPVSIDEILLSDLLPETSLKCSGRGASTTIRTSTDTGSIDSLLFEAEIEHRDSNQNAGSYWKARFSSGGNLYSFLGPYGEAIPDQSTASNPFVETVWQMSAKNNTGATPDVLLQAGLGGHLFDVNDINRISPSLGKHCFKNGCSFASWAQKSIPSEHDSNALLFSKVVDCGSGVVEITHALHNSADPVDTDQFMDTLQIKHVFNSSIFGDIFLSRSAGLLYTDAPYPGTKHNLQRDSAGFTALVTNKDDPNAISLSFVHGKDSEQFLDESFLNREYKRDNKIYWGHKGSNKVRYASFIDTKIRTGQTYFKRDYLVQGQLSNILQQSSPWVNETIQGLRDYNTLIGRTIHLYSIAGSSKFGATGENDKCGQGKVVCEGSSVPQEGARALFAMSCGNSHYVGPDKYFFEPDTNDPNRREYICNAGPEGQRPSMKLLGFYKEGVCAPIGSYAYDPYFCNKGVL